VLTTGLKARQQRSDALQAVHAHRLEIGTEHRFHCALPALLDAQLLRDARQEMQRLRFQPFGDLSRRLAQRRLLQRLGGHEFSLRFLMACAQRIEHFGLLAFRVAGRDHGCKQFLQLLARPEARACGGCRTLRQRLRRHAGL
jgi:hypothetical protein